jgi:TRAP transporter 4TM/12TM fusion protein
MRELKGISAIVVTILCASVTFLVFYTAFRGAFPSRIQTAGFLMFMIPLVLIVYPGSKKAPTRRIPIIDIVLASLAALSFAWILWDYGRIAYRIKYVSSVTNLDLLFGTMAILFVLEATRRTLGWILVVTTLVFIGYIFFGPYLPGILGFKAIRYHRFIEHLYLVPEGLFNIITVLASTYLFTFVAFGSFLRISGIDRYYMNLCLALAGKSRGGPAKVAVISSALMGTLTGSTISNLVTTGSLSIPMMKDAGFEPHEAAAIETASSTGGALTPPIMGAGVFVMSAITGIPVITILKYSVIPAILYFFSIFAFIEIKARKHGLKGLPEDELPSLKEVLKYSIHLFIPLVVLVIVLLMGFTPFIASASSTLLIVVCSFLRRETRMGPMKMLRAMEESAKNMMTITAVSACAAAIMGVITQTGLIMKVTSILISLSHGIVLLAVFLLCGISYVLGMGMPITLSYILVATLGAPALTQMGVPLLAAHLAIFWFSQDSTITPPICMTAFVAAEIAKVKNYMKVGFQTIKIAKSLYLIPLLFIYTPLLGESIQGPLRIMLQTLPLLIALAVFTEGFLLDRLQIWERVMAGISAVLLGAAVFTPGFLGVFFLSFLGISTVAILYNSQRKRVKMGEVKLAVRPF